MKTRIFHGVILTGWMAVGAPCLPVQDAVGQVDEATVKKTFARPYSPYAGRTFPTRPLFGDTHLHTMNSLDAATVGNRLGPEEAFRFARGEEVTASSGQRVRLSRPLDFLMVADHAEGCGAITELLSGNPLLLADPTLKRWSEMMQKGGDAALKVVNEMRVAVQEETVPKVLMSPKLARSVWEKHLATAERYKLREDVPASIQERACTSPIWYTPGA